MTCWRATSTRWPYFMGINALSQIHPDLASTLHGRGLHSFPVPLNLRVLLG